MGRLVVRNPLLFQSGIFCLSSQLSPCQSVSFSRYGCLLASPQTLYNLPKIIWRAQACSAHNQNYLFFPSSPSDYKVVLLEIHDLRRNSSRPFSSSVLRYMKGRGESFAGNFSTKRMKYYLDHGDDLGEIPCGFLSESIVRESGRVAMERSCGVVVGVAYAVFGDYDKIRQPKHSKLSAFSCS